MEPRVVRLVLVLVAVLAVSAVVTFQRREQSAAAQSEVAGDPSRVPPGTRAVVPVSRREVVLCLKGAGFDVHSGTPREVVVVAGRGLPAGTQVRIYGAGPGAVPVDTGGWRASAQALHTLGPEFRNVAVRRAFFNCVDPHLPPR